MAKKEKKLTPEQAALQHEEEEQKLLSPDEYRVVRAADIWMRDDTGHDLSFEQQLFVRSYMIDREPVAALRRLGYVEDAKVLKKKAQTYLANTEVQAAIETLGKRMMERLEVTAEKIQRRLAHVAFFDPREVMTFDHNGVHLIHSSLWPEHAIAAVQSVEVGQFGVKLKLYDALRATEMLAKQVGLQPDENTEAAAAAAEAAGKAVVDKLFEYLDRTVPDDPIPHTALPPPKETMQ